MATMSTASVRTRQQRRRLFEIALFVWGVAAAVNLVASGANDARGGSDWPRSLELVYLCSFLVAVPALVLAAWIKSTLKRLGAVVEDERTAATTRYASTIALGGALMVQLPYLFGAETGSSAQAKFTLAAALVTYGAARMWLGRDA